MRIKTNPKIDQSHISHQEIRMCSPAQHTRTRKNSIHHASPYSVTYYSLAMCDKNNFVFVSSGMTDFFMHTPDSNWLSLWNYTQQKHTEKLLISIRMGWTRLDETFFWYVFCFHIHEIYSVNHLLKIDACDRLSMRLCSVDEVHSAYTTPYERTIWQKQYFSV